MAHHNRPFLDNAANCGLLDSVDVFSFHTYGRAPEMQGLVDNYRAWLKAHDREAMPLWITECGRPWPKGPDRPPAEPDMISALDITMKAIEARCCGIERYFAFVYPFYEEQQQNFGMMGRLGTPLRSMAAYVRAASLLAGKTYLGDLVCDDASIQRARVFGDSRETVAVLYTGQPAAGASRGLACRSCAPKASTVGGSICRATDRFPLPTGWSICGSTAGSLPIGWRPRRRPYAFGPSGSRSPSRGRRPRRSSCGSRRMTPGCR